jgi:hypothetical protein
MQDSSDAPNLEASLTAQAGSEVSSHRAASIGTPNLSTPVAGKRTERGLDPAEFAAFLQRNTSKNDPAP